MKENNELTLFEGHYVECFELNGVVYFNPYHVGECLGISKTTIRDHLSNMNENQAKLLKNSDVDKIDFRKLNNAGEKFLTESGVYKVSFRSNKPEAEKFTNWVADDVLPALRKNGYCILTNADPDELRKKADELESLGTVNETAKILLKVFDEAGLKPQYKALALKQVYRKGGIELPLEELKTDKELYDLQTIAEKLGVYSTNNKPHRQAIGYIISQLNLEDYEKETVSFEANGHMGTTIQYTKSVIEKVKQWLSENNNPAEIKAEINGKSKKFLIKYKDVA